MRKIQIIPLKRREEARKVLNRYLTELAEFDPTIGFDEHSTPIYKWFDCYWDDKDRFPLFLMIGGQVAGLAMIRELEFQSYEISEFYVMPEYRKDGNAIWFASQVAELFEGEFVFSTRFTNPRAIKFWDKFAVLYPHEICDDEVWRNWTIRKSSAKVHCMNLIPKYFELIKCGEKTLEGRLNDAKRRAMKIGDIIEFTKDDSSYEKMRVMVLDKYLFSTFTEMAKELPKEKLGFADMNVQEMIKVYHKIYSAKDIAKYGVLILNVKLID